MFRIILQPIYKTEKQSTAGKSDEKKCLMLENITKHETAKITDMRQQIKLQQNKNNRLNMEPKYFLKKTELLAAQQMKTFEIADNKESFTKVRETSIKEENRSKHQRDYRTP